MYQTGVGAMLMYRLKVLGYYKHVKIDSIFVNIVWASYSRAVMLLDIRLFAPLVISLRVKTFSQMVRETSS